MTERGDLTPNPFKRMTRDQVVHDRPDLPRNRFWGAEVGMMSPEEMAGELGQIDPWWVDFANTMMGKEAGVYMDLAGRGVFREVVEPPEFEGVIGVPKKEDPKPISLEPEEGPSGGYS